MAHESSGSAITLCATMGGALFDLSGYRAAFGASTALLLIAGLLALMTSRAATNPG